MVEFNDRRTDEVSNPLESLHGSHDINAMFPEGTPKAGVPWQQMSRRKDRQDYDKDLVHHALGQQFHQHDLQPVDPRTLRASQPSLTRGGVEHYMGDAYKRTGLPFADQQNPGNRNPVVYNREGMEGNEPQSILLSGHHRAAAALLKGEPLEARVLHGPWGSPRGGRP
jgi:hypothetical protein